MFIYAVQVPQSSLSDQKTFQSRQKTLGRIAQIRIEKEQSFTELKAKISWYVTALLFATAVYYGGDKENKFITFLLTILMFKALAKYREYSEVRPTRTACQIFTPSAPIESPTLIGAIPQDTALANGDESGSTTLSLRNYAVLIPDVLQRPSPPPFREYIAEMDNQIDILPANRFIFNADYKDATNDQQRTLFFASNAPLEQVRKTGLSTQTNLYENFYDAADELETKILVPK